MSVSIECDDPVAQGWMTRLLRLPEALPGRAALHYIVRRDGSGYALHGADDGMVAQGTLGEIMEVTARLVGNHTAMHYQDGLALHAGLVVHQQRGILIAGASGAGKSTLTAWLLHRGLCYVTDELVYVPEAAEHVAGWGRPLHIKTGAWPRVVGWLKPCEPLHYPGGAFVPCEALGPAQTCKVAPDVVLFPEHTPGAAPTVQRLTVAQTARRLWCVTANTARLPMQGFHQVTMLARRLRAWSLTYGDVTQLEPGMGEWLG